MSCAKVKNSLLFLTQTLHDLKSNVKFLLEESFKQTNTTLFIYIHPLITNNNNQIENQVKRWKNANQLIIEDRNQLRTLVNQFYQNSNRLDPNINVICLLHNIHQTNKPKNNFKLSYDLVLTDTHEVNFGLEQFLKLNLPNVNAPTKTPFHIIDCPIHQDNDLSMPIPKITSEYDLISQDKSYANSIVGGTFDRLHIGHKMLLTECVLLTENRLLIGVADGDLLKNKKLGELIEDLDLRCLKLKEFLQVTAPTLDVITPPIQDPYGPSITEKDYQCLIVSQETILGGKKVNEKRAERNLPILDIHVIGLIKEDEFILKENSGDEEKVSSSNQRRHLLGTLLKSPKIPYDPTKPYVIGLTGGLASGKSNVRKDLANLGLATIDCDILGHRTYERGQPAYQRIIDAFGQDILNIETNEIDRRVLGKKVFNAPGELKKLTDIVWPEIKKLLQLEIDSFFEKGQKIILVEAAVLLEANWQENMNEVWVCFISDEVATERAAHRDNSNLERIKGTLKAQMSNKERLNAANVALCSLWEREYTIKQVKKAYNLLLERTTSKIL